MLSPALIAPLPVNRFPNKLAPNATNNIMRNPPFSSFASFSIVSLVPYINKLDYSRDLIIFMITFISSFEMFNVVVREAKSEGRPDPNIFLWTAALVADAAAVNPNRNKTLLANVFNKCFIKGKKVFSNGLRSRPTNLLDCPISCNWVLY